MSEFAQLSRTSIAGAVFIILLGVPLHFLYSSTGFVFVAWLAPINESTWEHLKLVFWPGVVWAAWEWARYPGYRKGFWSGKCVALFSSTASIVAIFYGYTAILGDNFFLLDIATFLLSVVIGQWLGYLVWKRERNSSIAFWLVLALAYAFVVFSYDPPNWFLFEAPRVEG